MNLGRPFPILTKNPTTGREVLKSTQTTNPQKFGETETGHCWEATIGQGIAKTESDGVKSIVTKAQGAGSINGRAPIFVMLPEITE
jgi:hypothetical protein